LRRNGKALFHAPFSLASPSAGHHHNTTIYLTLPTQFVMLIARPWRLKEFSAFPTASLGAAPPRSR
jgi:hypothetical protein